MLRLYKAAINLTKTKLQITISFQCNGGELSKKNGRRMQNIWQMHFDGVWLTYFFHVGSSCEYWRDIVS